jgi:tol-pal system protein YbgF
MAPQIITRTLLGAVSLLLVQCVPLPSQDINSLDLRIRNLDSRIVKIDQAISKYSGQGPNNPIDRLQKNQAEMVDQLDRLNNELLQLKGQLEENSHFYTQLGEENSEFKSSIEMKVTDLSAQILVLADQINQTSDQLNAIKNNTELSLQKVKEAENRAATAEKEAADARKKAAAPPKDSATRKIVPDQTKLTPTEKEVEKATQSSGAAEQGPGKEIYDQALSLFRLSKFNEAYRTFTEYIEKYPQGKMAPNARFWLGDCYYSQQEYELAILEYQKVIADYPNHGKAPAALLKQGLAFEKLHDKETASIVYRKLLDDYPKSEQIEMVKKQLESLK